MRAAAKKRGYQLDSRAQTIAPDDFERFDLIIAMDRDNVQAIRRVGNPSPGQLKLLSDYLGDDWPNDVPDPYYGGEDGFEYVLDMLEAACPKILEEIQRVDFAQTKPT
jgi:protein-tyrosine phosphatase